MIKLKKTNKITLASEVRAAPGPVSLATLLMIANPSEAIGTVEGTEGSEGLFSGWLLVTP